jgi:hypothetical protein
MTDLNDRLAAMLENEPPAPYDIDREVSNGRRALRRRTTLTAVAGTAGTAALTAAVVVPIATLHGGSGNKISVFAQPTPTAPPTCKAYLQKSPSKAAQRHTIAQLRKKADRRGVEGTTITTHSLKYDVTEIQVCPPGANPDASPHPTTPPDPTATMPPYHYSEPPQAIADRLSHHLTKQVEELGFEVVYTRPFAQESSELEKGHPAYYDGNVDVRLPDGPADIGVQVTHAVTQLVPFTDECDDAATCQRTTLADGSLLQISHIDAGSGGAEVISVEIHHTDGLVVQAQMSNYAFGPEATRDRTKHQPLTIDQLTQLAQDPAWTF